MPQRLPASAILLGIAGLLPLLGCAVAAILLPDPKGATYLAALINYAAVILAFLGAVHWGFALTAMPPRVVGARLSLGVLPALIGWIALLLQGAVGPMPAIALLAGGFAATVLTEQSLRRQGLVSPGYMWLRWALSSVVLIVLGIVMMVKISGIRV